MSRVVLLGPESPRVLAVQSALRAHGHDVVVSQDVAHGVLLLRVVKPDVVIAVHPLHPREHAFLATAGIVPLVLVADLDPAQAVAAVGQGVARAVPTGAADAVFDAVARAPLALERPVGRALGQLALLRASGALHVRQNGDLVGSVVLDGGSVVSSRLGASSGDEALARLLAIEVPVDVSYVSVPAAADGDAGFAIDTITLDEVVDDDPAPSAPPPAASSAPLLVERPAPPPRVLVAEDDPAILKLYATVLGSRGFAVVCAEDGVAAFEAAHAHFPDVILSDIMMPRATGWDLLGMVRNSARLRETPFLLLSHHSEMVARLKNAASGADAYLEKSQRPDQIAQAVHAAVAPRRELARLLDAGVAQFEGRVAGLGIQTLLRALAARSISGRVAVRSGASRILVTLHAGDLVDARVSLGANAVHLREALRALLLVDDGTWMVVRSPIPGPVVAPLLPLLDELCAELEQLLEDFRSGALLAGRPLHLRPALLAAYRETCPDAARVIVDLVASGQPPRTLLDDGVDPLLVDSVVRDMFRKGVISP